MLGSIGWSEYLVFALVWGVLTFIVATAKGRQPAWWTILSLLFGFLPLIVLVFMPSKKPQLVTIVPDPATTEPGGFGFPAAQPIPNSDAAELERLAALHANGSLTDDEFAAAKARVLGQQR